MFFAGGREASIATFQWVDPTSESQKPFTRCFYQSRDAIISHTILMEGGNADKGGDDAGQMSCLRDVNKQQGDHLGAT